MKSWSWLVALLGGLGLSAKIAFAVVTTDTIDESGINALRLHQPPYQLTGRKIALGQIEVGRPGKFGTDKAASKQRSIAVQQVFYRNQLARANRNVDSHAYAVAGIMVSHAKKFPGIAPQARLYSAAVGMSRRNGQPEACLGIQQLALQNGGDLRAINFSFGESLRYDPRPNAVLDGNALLTQCLDWSARVHDVLYMVAGNQGEGGISIPTDNFNGLNIAAATRVNGIYTKVDFTNISDPPPALASGILGKETNVGPRRSVSLIAPGRQVPALSPENRLVRQTGTSFAAPHVTATVALLQEFGDTAIRQALAQPLSSRSKWNTNARRHEVMKAVLINAADKLKDQGDGLRLGMSRTVVNKTNRTWLDSDAHRDRRIPLDQQMGAGHLNAYRAYQQFSPGQWGPGAAIPAIGWDYRSVGLNRAEHGLPAYRDYYFEHSLKQGSAIAMTLVWDRRVELLDANNNGEYDSGESFRDRGLNDLNLYLMRAEDQDPTQNIASSESQVDSVEHLFYTIPRTGRYKIRVQFRQVAPNSSPNQAYALAWWTVSMQ